MSDSKGLSQRQVAYLQAVFPENWQERLPMAEVAFNLDVKDAIPGLTDFLRLSIQTK